MEKSNAKITLILSCSLFICLGISNSAIGPLLPELARNAHAPLESMGSVYTALFLGSIFTQLISGLIIDRLGQKPVLLIGIVLMVIGLGAYNFPLSFPALMAFTVLAGLGFGAVVLGNNFLIAQAFSERSVSALNLINFFFGLGAILGPAIVSLVLSHFGEARWVIGLDTLLYLVLVPLFYRMSFPAQKQGQESLSIKRIPSLLTPLIIALGSMVFLYVGIETGFGGWISTYMQKTTNLTVETASLVTSAFWLAFTIGRLLNTWLGLRLSAQRILLMNLTLAVLGSVIFTAGIGNQWISILGTLLIGLAFGPIYPTLIAVSSQANLKNPGQTVSIVSALGGAGGMLIPLFQGYLIFLFGPISNALLAVIVILIILLLMINTRKNIAPVNS